MKIALLLVVTVALSGCGHFRPANNPSGTEALALRPHDSIEARRGSMDDRAIVQRTKMYEDQGHSAGEARALAEIEKVKTGR